MYVFKTLFVGFLFYIMFRGLSWEEETEPLLWGTRRIGHLFYLTSLWKSFYHVMSIAFIIFIIILFILFVVKHFVTCIEKCYTGYYH